MADQSEGSKPAPRETGQDQVQNPGRRQLLRRAAAGAAGLAGAALLGQVGSKSAEAGRGPVESQSFDLPKILTEKHPELQGLKAKQLEVDGAPVEDSLDSGPKIFRFHAENGQRVKSIINPASGDWAGNLNPDTSFTLTDLYDEKGDRRSVEGNIIVESQIFSSGDYFLLVKKDERAKPRKDWRFNVEVQNPLDHGIQMRYLTRLGTSYHSEVRFQPEDRPILPNGNFGIVLNFNEMYKNIDKYEIEISAAQIPLAALEAENMDLVPNGSGSVYNLSHEMIREDDSPEVTIYPNGGRWPEGSMNTSKSSRERSTC